MPLVFHHNVHAQKQVCADITQSLGYQQLSLLVPRHLEQALEFLKVTQTLILNVSVKFLQISIILKCKFILFYFSLWCKLWGKKKSHISCVFVVLHLIAPNVVFLPV